MFTRENPDTNRIYKVYMYFEGLSLRAASKALKPVIKRRHIALWR